MALEYRETTYNPDVEEYVRKEQDRRVVQEGTEMWRRRKEELQRQKHREQRELRQMQANYSPWGKPGGGAPFEKSLRKKNVLLEPLEPRRSHSTQANQSSPWGRPGPGGVPWRDPKLLGIRFLESMGWTTGSFISRLRRKEMNPLAVIDSNRFFDDKPEPEITSNMISSKRNPSMQKDDLINNGNSQIYKLTGGVELVPLLTTRKCYSYPIRHIVTDATRPGYTIDDFRSVNDNREYITALSDQIQRKRQNALEEKRLEQESCRRHFDTWKKFWGRPGHGAPMDHVYRNDLYNILYRSGVC
ncbi:uncharacterized protein [Chelonus insularis]|uniref:uncharacterized protein isoform X2 n=1 Tax=Chelonus insularis TaxID=460826 RepID=UPI00158CB631|nr:uncharacterized protein LOC118072425 isoform X2 [Chelonus insularis]